VVEFHGYCPPLSGVVLTEYAMSMDRYFAHRRLSNDPNSDHLFVAPSVWQKWASQLLEGLCFIHDHGVVHCDIKPDNILLDENLTPHICDFSSAMTSDDVPCTKQLAVGAVSIEYCAPELLRHKDAIPSPRSDLFSYGLILLEAATGAPPYSGAVKGFTQKYQWAVRGAALDSCLPELLPRLASVRSVLTAILERREDPRCIRLALASVN
jgi:serine/threonine protein kinase